MHSRLVEEANAIVNLESVMKAIPPSAPAITTETEPKETEPKETAQEAEEKSVSSPITPVQPGAPSANSDAEELILMAVKEAENFYHRMKEQLSNEPANLDARIGGPVELSGEWKGESKHKVTGDVTGWDRVTIIFTGNENSSDDLTGSIEGAGYVQLVALSIHARIVTE